MRWLFPRRLVWRGAICFLLLILVVLAADLILVRMGQVIHPGYDNTRITRPLLPDGSIDYLKALDDRCSIGVTPENNAVTLLLQAWGPAAFPAQAPPDEVTKRLGMAHLPETGEYLVQYADFVRPKQAPISKYEEIDFPDDLYFATDWPVSIVPLTRQWIEANRKPLDLVVTASARPRFFFPHFRGHWADGTFQMWLPDYSKLLKVSASALGLRALLCLEQGDVTGYQNDLLATHRLAHLTSQGMTCIEESVATYEDLDACRVDRIGAYSGKLSPAQARSQAAELAAQGEFPPIADRVDIGERYTALDRMETPFPDLYYAAAIVPNGFNMPGWALRLVPLPHEKAMRLINQWYDGAVAALRQCTYALDLAAAHQWNQPLLKMEKRNPLESLVTGVVPALLNMTDIPEKLRHEYSAKAQIRLTEISLGLAAYKADHGAYPLTLADLSPSELASVPLDPFVDRPFVYAPTAKGFTLYSLGPNMVDDGGKTGTPADDIVVSEPQPPAQRDGPW